MTMRPKKLRERIGDWIVNRGIKTSSELLCACYTIILLILGVIIELLDRCKKFICNEK
jgi:hypothetical protein